MKKIAFSGAAGNGISPLEQIMTLKGYEVYGSDYSFDIGKDLDRKKALESVGIHIVPQNGSAITDDLEFLCVSAAINESNPDIKAALEKNIPIKKRSDLLQEVFSEYKYGIAVGGTAGKTTTTAMIGYVLDVLGKKPCMVNGGALCNFSDRKGIPNYIYNEGDICV
ncbi:MAG: Mur ligase domain-containing protein, partial [Alphaproteobacteria bacterium]|nr:Mur ligase domain-containing protein [Alphaproteobacteria bacterium]